MSLTLGEKLRQAREARGISISEVAEQTRISALYLESIENNDYRGLPGGIFNKGFVKSYAKYVGLDEQESLHDYSKLIAEQGEDKVEETKTYRPEVLTDDRSGGSMLPTLIFAALILGLLTWGVISLVNWLNAPKTEVVAANTSNSNKSPNTGSTTPAPVNANGANTAVPSTSELTIQFKSTSTEPAKPALTTTMDGVFEAYTFQGDEPKVYTPKQWVKINYYKGNSAYLQLTINGKPITLPSQPFNGKGMGVNFVISKTNLAMILEKGAITAETEALIGAANANANTANAAAPTPAAPAANVNAAKPR